MRLLNTERVNRYFYSCHIKNTCQSNDKKIKRHEISMSCARDNMMCARHYFFQIKKKMLVLTRNTVSNAHKMTPPLPHVLYGKVLVLLWEAPKSFE